MWKAATLKIHQGDERFFIWIIIVMNLNYITLSLVYSLMIPTTVIKNPTETLQPSKEWKISRIFPIL